MTAGRFRFVDLPDGFYTFQVTAPGLARRELERLPAGKQNLAVTLKRSD